MIASSAAHKLIDSHATWWALAGLETNVGEEPFNWLAIPATPQHSTPLLRVSAATANAPNVSFVQSALPAPDLTAPQKSEAVSPIPEAWAKFQTWLADDPAVPGTRWNMKRILPQGGQGARLMILSLCPEMGDEEAGLLHSGAQGVLLDSMLRAIGLTRNECYLASVALTRPPGGRIDEFELAKLVPLLWHHVRLARPERLLIFGADLARIFAATDVATARGQLLLINQDGVKVEAVATQHPLLLLDRPMRKAAAWDSLKRFAQG